MSAPNAIAVASMKGGVGKTSLVANLAGESARLGLPTCVIDLDPQGDVASDLGIRQRDESDLGARLYLAVVDGQPVQPLAGVRPNLDVVPGGNWSRRLSEHLRTAGPLGLDHLVRDLASRYQLVFIDCPPSAGELLTAALVSAGNLIVPTRGDQKSFDGMVRLSEEFLMVKSKENPALDVLGVVLFGFPRSATRQLEMVRRQIGEDLGDNMLLFDTSIRHLDAPVLQIQRAGRLAQDISASESASGVGLAEDYQALFREVYGRLQHRWENEPPLLPDTAPAEPEIDPNARTGLLSRIFRR